MKTGKKKFVFLPEENIFIKINRPIEQKKAITKLD